MGLARWRPSAASHGAPAHTRPGGSFSAGILTFHRCINYGSYWQALCLAEGLGSLGWKAMLLDHRSPRVDRAEWRCALQPQLPIATRTEDHALFRRKVCAFFEAFERLPLSAPIALDRPILPSDLDLILVGSDEVWNLKHPWYGGSPLFFGEGLSESRIAAYAASFGNLEVPCLDAIWTERLARFRHISVRDLNSRNILRRTLGIDPPVVLDPCLLFPDPIAQLQPERDWGRHAIVYGHGFPLWFQEAVRSWASRRKIALVSIGYRNDWADEQWIEAGPSAFPGAVAGAKAVITNFFHGCVFSLINAKPFVCVLSDYRANKIRDLAAIAGVGHHIADERTPQAQLHANLDEPLDETLPSRIADLRRRSMAYLRHVPA